MRSAFTLVFAHASYGALAAALALAAVTYVANIGGSILGGTMADRWGRTETILLWSCVSLALSFSIGWLVGAPAAVLVLLACAYNFSAIADSSTHSTLLAESVPPHQVGVAFSVRSAIGFGAGVVSPVVSGWALDAAGGAREAADPHAWGIAWATLSCARPTSPRRRKPPSDCCSTPATRRRSPNWRLRHWCSAPGIRVTPRRNCRALCRRRSVVGMSMY